MTITIYGLFDKEDKCRYVGQTRSPRNRKASYSTRYPDFEFRVLTVCMWLLRTPTERAIIRQYRAIGQCDLNSKLTGKPERHPRARSKVRPHSVEVIGRDGSVRVVEDCDYDHAL